MSEKEIMEQEAVQEKGISRRKLLGAGAIAAGTVAAGTLLQVAPALSSEAISLEINGKKVTSPVAPMIVKGTTLVPIRVVSENLGAQVNWDGTTRTVKVNMAQSNTPPAWPWPYKKIDVEVVRKRGYENYFKGGCMYGAASALLSAMVETIGYPYNLIPQDMFKYGAGGSSSWGTLCGALNGSSAVINMVTKDYAKLVSELNGWYTEFPFPSNKHEGYCKIKNQVTTVSKSPLCHQSVSIWAKAAGAKINEDAKKDRCAKLTGDVAAKTAELLNAYMVDNAFTASYKASSEFSHCLACHNGATSALDNEQGLMNCVTCHTDHTK